MPTHFRRNWFARSIKVPPVTKVYELLRVFRCATRKIAMQHPPTSSFHHLPLPLPIHVLFPSLFKCPSFASMLSSRGWLVAPLPGKALAHGPRPLILLFWCQFMTQLFSRAHFNDPWQRARTAPSAVCAHSVCSIYFSASMGRRKASELRGGTDRAATSFPAWLRKFYHPSFHRSGSNWIESAAALILPDGAARKDFLFGEIFFRWRGL